MRVLFDTSVLVAAINPAHAFHAAALPWLERAKQGAIELIVAAHTLAELYATLTSMPLTPRISPTAACQLIDDNVLQVARVVALSEMDYQDVLRQVSQAGHVSGVIYDALIAKAGELAGVDRLVTLDVSDFQRSGAVPSRR